MTKSAKTDLTAERVREVWDYSPDTGIFRWKIAPPHKPDFVGRVAGCLGALGYWVIGFEQHKYPAHVLAWLYVHGEWPSDELDHQDMVRHHNWISNLRIANQTLNNANRKSYSNNQSGFKGVYRHQGRWRAMIRLDGQGMHIGSYDTPEEANSAYVAKAKELFGEFANPG
jgi:hypothetical protein